MLISTVLFSCNGLAEAQSRNFPVGEFNIELNANQSWDTADVSLTELQQKNLMNDDFVNTIESIDGVSGTKCWYYTDAEYHVNDYDNDWICERRCFRTGGKLFVVCTTRRCCRG